MMTPDDYEQNANQLYWIKDSLLATDFPDVNKALGEPDGLLAIGGALTEKRLLEAYQKGIFPWFNEGQPVLWWSPDPRCVLIPEEIRISRSLAKRIRNHHFKVTFNQAFAEVLEACAAARKGIESTWITPDMQLAYSKLFRMGYAHSVECWQDERLVGGLYGLAMGKVFFGESMFSRKADASKVALVNLSGQLQDKAFKLIDCQVHSSHLQTLGAKLIHRSAFIRILKNHCSMDKLSDCPSE